jgi:O-antigen/teichoic acid export membrane protein
LSGHAALALGFAAQLLQYGSGLLLLPFVLTRLSPAEVGIWYLFLTVQSLAFLADFGFQPTLTRAFSAAYAGSSEIRKQGLAEALGRPNLILVEQILRLCRGFYMALAAAVLLLLLTAGTAYIRSLTAAEPLDSTNTLLVWFLLSVGTAAQLYFSWNSAFLTGGGQLAANYANQIASRAGFVGIGIVALSAGWGLLGLAVANIASIIVARIYAQLLMRPLLRPLSGIRAAGGHTKDVLRALWPNASRMGLVALGAFLITRVNVLIISTYMGLPTVASYALSLQLLAAVTSVAQLPMQVAIPKMVQLRVVQDIAGLRSLFIRRQAFLLLVFVSGALFVVVAGQPLLDLVGSRVQLLAAPLLLLLSLVLLLETNHSACGLVITTANHVPFVAPALISGLAVAALASFAAWYGLGVAGVILAQGVVQLAYNNWKWPLLLWNQLREPVRTA